MENIGITLPNLQNDFESSLLDIFDDHGGKDVVK